MLESGMLVWKDQEGLPGKSPRDERFLEGVSKSAAGRRKESLELKDVSAFLQQSKGDDVYLMKNFVHLVDENFQLKQTVEE